MSSWSFGFLVAGVKNRAADFAGGVGSGRVCGAVGRGVEEKLKRGVALN